MMNDETLTNARYLGLRMLDLYSGSADELLDDAGQELLRLDSENEELRRENERLRELLNRFEYSSDGYIKRYPEEEEVEAVLRREDV